MANVEFTPQLIIHNPNDVSVTVIIHGLRRCPQCDKWMTDYVSFREQLKSVGVSVKDKWKECCEDCESIYNNTTFECHHCEGIYSKSEIQHEVHRKYDEYLCKKCYNTLTAAQWDMAVESCDSSSDWTE